MHRMQDSTGRHVWTDFGVVLDTNACFSRDFTAGTVGYRQVRSKLQSGLCGRGPSRTACRARENRSQVSNATAQGIVAPWLLAVAAKCQDHSVVAHIGRIKSWSLIQSVNSLGINSFGEPLLPNYTIDTIYIYINITHPAHMRLILKEKKSNKRSKRTHPECAWLCQSWGIFWFSMFNF